MFSVAHVLIDTFTKLILAQVSTEEMDILDVAHVFMHAFVKLLAQVCIE